MYNAYTPNAMSTACNGLNQLVMINIRLINITAPNEPKIAFFWVILKFARFIFFICKQRFANVIIGNKVMTPDKNKYFDLLKREALTIIEPPSKNCKMYPNFLLSHLLSIYVL